MVKSRNLIDTAQIGEEVHYLSRSPSLNVFLSCLPTCQDTGSHSGRLVQGVASGGIECLSLSKVDRRRKSREVWAGGPLGEEGLKTSKFQDANAGMGSREERAPRGHGEGTAQQRLRR